MGATGIYGSTGMTDPIKRMPCMPGSVRGVTGMTGMTCVICHQTPILFQVDLNLSTKPKENEDIHLICEKCINYTQKLIKKVKKNP